ncbi:Putative LOC100644115 [Caligus rogercresseyi]|uniref:LOC100644115 n=1 Tax=Caligus rogercresseyi TaxID=217165 RepID=A0A7T8GM05_CALRO|nr:Putative LOC100644115 [Caligus rogercresseyi]
MKILPFNMTYLNTEHVLIRGNGKLLWDSEVHDGNVDLDCPGSAVYEAHGLKDLEVGVVLSDEAGLDFSEFRILFGHDKEDSTFVNGVSREGSRPGSCQSPQRERNQRSS